MKRAVLFVAIVSTLIASYSLLVRASRPQVPSNAWSATGDMALARAGALAVLLPDGRVLVTGGTNEGGVTASVERYSPTAGGFLATPSMENARANHTATMLEDGRVLVIGGIGSDGHAIASAELYDPSANAWTAAAPLYHARSGHSATLLWDGRVLVAGGDDTGVADATLEVFDPISATFSAVDAVLSAARTGHAAASLADGRVLIVGGFDGTSALASVDVYDPRTNTVSPGPSLAVVRAGHSATTLLDGRVLIAGGASDSSELASAEIFDPSTGSFTVAANAMSVARQRHVAFLLPHNNNVLIVGGTAGGNAVATAELFTPWESDGGTFCATAVCESGFAGPSAPNAARAWAAGAALSVPASETIRTGPADGLLLIAGGSVDSTAASPTKSAELYGFATVTTEKEDYAPGTTVTIRGSGWQPGEWVALLLKEYPAYDEHQLVDVQADENGNIVSTEFVPDQHDVGIRFYLTAFGQQSQAQTTFRDNENLTGVSVGAQSPSTITPGSSTTYVVTVSFQKVGGNASCTADLSVSGLASGATGAFSPSFLTKTNGDANLTSTLTVNTAAAISAGTTSFTVTATGRVGTDCQTTTKTATGNLVVKRVASIINVSATNGAPGASTSLGAKLVDAVTANGIGSENITFTINGVASASDVTNGGGNASATGTLPASPGTYPVVASFSGNSTYGAATGSTTVTVGAPATTLIVSSATGTYGGTTSLSATLTQTSGGSPVSGKTISLTLNGGSVGTAQTNSSGVATVATASLGGINAGSYATGVAASFGGDSSFAASIGNNSLTVNQKALTVTNITATNKVYDRTTSATLNTASAALVGVLVGDVGSVTLNTATAIGMFADKNVGTGKTVTVSGLTISGSKASNYSLAQPATTADITVKGLTVSGVTASNKVYDRTTTATLNTASAELVGVISGDTVALNTASATGAFADKNVGVGKTVTVSDLTIGGMDSGNYLLTQPTTTADITAKNVTVSGVAASNKIYDGNTTATLNTGSAALVGVIAGDLVALDVAGASGAFATKAVGVGKVVTVTGLTLGDADASNYVLMQPSGVTANITPRPLSVTGASAVSRPYDGTTVATLDFSGASLVDVIASDDVTIDHVSAAGAFGDKNVATNKPVTVTGVALSGADAANYTVSQPSGLTASITVVNLTATIAASDKDYDGTATATITNCSLGGVVGSEAVSCTTSNAHFTSSHASSSPQTVTVDVALTGADAGNYTLTTPATTSARINAKAASVTPNAASKTYGTADPEFSGSLEGFVPSDGVTASYSRTAGETVAGSPYTISAVLSPAGVLENYKVTYNTANFTIVARSLTVTASGVNRGYDGTMDASVTLSDDRVAGDVLTIGYAAASFANKNVGTAKPISVSGISVTGTAAGNYTFNTTASASADIIARPITVAAIAISRIYDATTASSGVPTISSGTLASGDTLSFAQTYDNKNVGTAKTLTPAGVVNDGNGGNNYAVTLATNTAGIITPRSLTVAATALDKAYDGTTTATVTLSDNRVAGDVLTESYASANFANKNVGQNKVVTVSGIANSGADSGNYALSSTSTTTTASITKRALTVTAVTDAKIYDGTVASNKVPLISGETSLAGGDTAALAEAFDTPNVGTGKTLKPTAVVNDGNGGNNYAVTLVNDVTGVIGAWSLNGFYQPVTMSSGAIVYNTIKGGSTVPLKFNIYAGAGGAEQTTTSAVQSFVLQLISCTPGIDDPVDESFSTTGGTALRYDSTAGQFIQNWQSPKVAGKCYAVTMTAQDSSTVTAYFKTK
jgi:hypothetical protein